MTVGSGVIPTRNPQFRKKIGVPFCSFLFFGVLFCSRGPGSKCWCAETGWRQGGQETEGTNATQGTARSRNAGQAQQIQDAARGQGANASGGSPRPACWNWPGRAGPRFAFNFSPGLAFSRLEAGEVAGCCRSGLGRWSISAWFLPDSAPPNSTSALVGLCLTS
jgi:hypothetical protein